MAFNLTTKAQALREASNVQNQIIVEIDGIPTIYGAIKTSELVRIGQAGLFIGDFTIGGSNEIPNSKPYISLAGTTKNINTQMRQDEGAESSITKFNVEIVDYNNEVSNEMASGVNVPDILGRECNVYVSFDGLDFPEDATKIFNGIVDDFETTPTTVNLSIAHPERLKRRELFLPTNGTLQIPINDTATIIAVGEDFTNKLKITNDDFIKTYVRIDDEIIEYTATGSGTLLVSERGALNTVASSHDADTDVVTFYRLQGQPVELALNLMLSGGDEYYFTEMPLRAEDNRFYFKEFDLFETDGVTENDLVTVTGSVNGNDRALEIITEVGKINGESFIELLNPINDEIGNNSLTVQIKSKYNVMSEGCAMKPSQVDVAQHELIDSLSQGFPDYDFYLKEEVNAKEFISKEIYFPVGMYSLNRKARASVGYTLPPIALFEIYDLDANSVLKPETIRVKRSTNKDFYNTVHYKFNEDSLEDKFLAGRVTIDVDSTNRIDVGDKQLLIESKGLRNVAGVNNFLDNQSERFLDRYKFSAERISFEVSYQFGFPIELGDRIRVIGSDLNMFLYSQGTRQPQPKIFEVVDKKMAIIDGNVVLTCLDTVFGVQGRFATFAPGSLIGPDATTTRLPIKKSFGTTVSQEEGEKWSDFLNEKVIVRTSDYSTSEVTEITAISDDALSVKPLSFMPPEDTIVELAPYDDAGDNSKTLHGFSNPQVEITLQIDAISFEVDLPTRLFEGSLVQVHDADYNNSEEKEVASVVGNVVTLKEALSFTPSAGFLVDRIGFVSDKGDSYLYI